MHKISPKYVQFLISRDSYGRIGERIGGPEEDSNSTGRSTESTNHDPWEFLETESPTKDHAGAGPRPPTHL